MINQNLPIAQRPDKNNNKHDHAEAFCLMVYEHEKCGHEEIIYNPRDSVTPFLIPCPNCCEGYYKNRACIIDASDLMRHQIALMNYQPDFKPPQGMFVFHDDGIVRREGDGCDSTS